MVDFDEICFFIPLVRHDPCDMMESGLDRIVQKKEGKSE